MKRVLSVAVLAVVMAQPALASANLDCEAKDKNAEFVIEAITSRDGKYLDRLRGELTLASGAKFEIERQDVKSYNWGRNVALVIAKQTPQGPLEIRIYAKAKDDIDLEGNYVLTAGKTKLSGKVSCSGG
jgi:hypothetical protein